MSTKKYYTMDEVRELLKVERPVINSKLTKKLKKIVKKNVISTAKKEAIEILLMANQKELGDFLYYYQSGSSVFLSVIDTIKIRLVKEGKLTQNETDNFGRII